MTGTYCLKRSTLWAGWGCVLSSLVFGMMMTGASIAPGARVLELVLVLGAAPLLIFCYGVYLLRAFKRCRVIVSDDGVEVAGVFSTRRVTLDEVRRARWRIVYSQELVLCTAAEKVKIPFEYLDDDAQRTLIRFFRRRFPLEMQEGWPRFWERYWGIFDLPDPADPIAQEIVRKRRRGTDLVFLFGFILMLVTTLPLWAVTGNPRCLMSFLSLLALAPFWWYLRKIVSTPGKLQVKHASHKATKDRSIFEVIGAILFAVALPLLLIALIYEERMMTYTGLIVLGLAYILLVFPAVSRQRKERLANDKIDFPRLAEEEYLSEQA